MYSRPKPGEDAEDLEAQAQKFLNDPNFKPAAKISLKGDKRKSKVEESSTTRPKSKFAQKHSKKVKEDLIDYTVLDEVLSRKDKVAACSSGRIIAHDVPTINAPMDVDFYASVPSVDYIPVIKDFKHEEIQSLKAKGIKKSLYRLQLECEKSADTGNKDVLTTNATTTYSKDHVLEYLKDQSSIIGGGLDNTNMIKDIHLENVSVLSTMSHEQRLAEQADLLQQMTPEQVQFLQNLRKKKNERTEASTSSSNKMADCPRNKFSLPSSSITTIESKMEVDEIFPEVDMANKNGTLDNQQKITDNMDVNDQKKTVVKFSEKINVKEIPHRSDDMSQLPINPREAKKWLHMDKVEMDKLKWMTDLPSIKPLKNGEGHTARFSFEGDLLPYDADIDVKAGLHHHGEEPERAGYSLDELFILSRSKVIQQRHIALRTLANILRNAKEGLYDNCFESPILQLMVDAGVVIILRFSLDENSSLIYQEAIRGLYYLVVSEGDEKCLDLVEPFVPTGLQLGVSSITYANEKTRAELHEEEKDLKDVEILSLDMIRALIRMDCHLRLRYFLEMLKPSSQCVFHIIGILTRIVRHSLTAAWTIASTPRLISMIIDNFLPKNITSLLGSVPVSRMETVYGVPLWQALRLLRIWASNGRQLASTFVNNYNILNHLSVFITIEPTEIRMPMQDALLLSQEAYSLWAVLIRYGIPLAIEQFKSCMPLFTRQLLFYRDKVSINEKVEENKYNYDVGSQMINVIVQIFNIAATSTFLTTKMKQNQPTVVNSEGKTEVILAPPVDWEDLTDFYPIIETCYKKWATELSRANMLSFSAFRLLGSTCTFLNIFILKSKEQKSFDAEKYINQTKTLYSYIINIISSKVFENVASHLKDHSALASSLQPGILRDPVNLGSIGCITYLGKVIPLIKETSAFPLLYPLSNFILTLFNANPSLDRELLSNYFDSTSMLSYLTDVTKTNSSLFSQWITRIEVHTLANFSLISSYINIKSKLIYHEIAIHLIPTIYGGDEHLVKTLLQNVICNNEFVADIDEVSSIVESLDFKEWEPLKSPSMKQPTLSSIELNKNLLTSLPNIGSIIAKNMISFNQLESSIVLKNSIWYLTETITIENCERPLVADNYFPIYPVKRLISIYKDRSMINTDEFVSDMSCPEIILLAKCCMQLSYLLLRYRKKSVFVKTNVTGWLRHLGLVFLCGNDLFLDAEVNSYLQINLLQVLKNEGYTKFNFDLRFDGLGSAYEWYRQLLQQFMAVSYGDLTFAMFIILLCQQYCPDAYRKLLWGDMCDALPLIQLTEKHIANFVPVEQFLEPYETKKELFDLYRRGLSMGVSPRRTPLLYKIALHHVHHSFKTK